MASETNIDQLHAFFEFSSELFAVLTEDGRFHLLNPAWQNTLGYNPDELKSLPFFDLLPPEDLSQSQLEIQRLNQGVPRVSFETRCRRKDQEYSWVRWNCQFSQEEKLFYLTGHDISDLKEAEKALKENRDKFNRLSDSAKEGVAIHERGIIIEANQALASLMGYQHPEEILGLNGLEFPAPEYRPLVQDHVTKGYDQPYEVVMQRKDGSRFDCLVFGKPIQYQGRMMRVTTFLDITTLKKREQELFESKELFRKLTEASQDGIAVSEKGVILLANPALSRMFGLELSEMIGRNALEFTAPEFRETLLKKVMEETESRYEVMGLRRDGSRFPVEITPRMTTYQGRRVRLAFFHDITQRKKIEEEVLRQKEFSQNLIQSSIDGLMAFDQECRYTLWNPAMERLTGHSREEVLGRCAFDIFPFLKQIGQDRHFQEALQGKTVITKDRPYRTPAGRQGSFESVYSPIKNIKGEIVGGLGIIHDTTERKRAEEALRQSETNLKAVFQNTFQNIVLMDREGRIQAFNTNAAADIKESTGKELETGRNIFDYVHSENAELLKKNFARALKGEVVQMEKAYLMGDGEEHWFELNYNPVFGDAGEIEGICLTSLDIDDRKRVQQALQKSEADLRAVFNSSSRGFILAGPDGKIRDFNQIALRDVEEMRGQRLEAGRDLWEYVETEFVKDFKDRFKRVLGGETIHLERPVRNPAGEEHWFEFTYNPVLDFYGQIIGVCAAVGSIDERKKAAASLQESEEKFRRIFEDAPMAMAMVNDYKFMKVNRAFLELLGYSESEMTGKSLLDITYPEDLPETRDIAGKIHHQEQENFRIEKRYLRKNGESLWATVSGTLIRDGHGRKLYALIMVENITDRKLAQESLRKSEADLRAVFNSGSQVVVLIGPDGNIQGFNQFAEVMAQRVLGGPLLKGTSFLKTLPPGADPEIFKASFQAALEGKESQGERCIRSAEGKERWVEVKYQPVLDDKKEVRGVCFSLGFIDDRKKAEEALRESQERFERLVQVTREGVLLHENPKVVDANPALARMLGYSVEEMIGKSGFDFLAPESRDGARGRMAEGSSAPYEVLALRKDGSHFPVELQGENFPYKGRELRVMSVRDLTWQKAAEKILTESEDRYRRLVELSPEAIVVHSGGKILYVNPAGLEMFAAAPENVEGSSLLEFLHPESRDVALARVKQIMEKREATEWVEQKLVRLKGGEFDAETKGIPFLYKGVPSVLTIVRDITERKKAEKALLEREEHYRHLVEAIPLAIMLVDEGKRVVSANAEAVKLFKAGRPEDLIGKSVMDFILPENRGIVGERLRGTLAEGADAPTRETELLALNGERVQVEVSGIPLIYQGRTSALSLFRDITERKKTQETLLRFERLAAVGKVIAAIAHEIRNPLAVVSGMSQILKAKLENQPEFSKDLETILSQAERLKYFLNDILDFSRSMEIRKMEIDAKGLLEASLAFARAQMGPQVGSTQVKWKFEKSLPKLLADRGRLEQVLINLIINAYQALAGAGTITLSAKTKDNMMLLGVEDNGPGVPESDIARLFEPFFTTKKGGSGLGLSISQKIVETHSGRITVKQISPHGMLFTLHLPLS